MVKNMTPGDYTFKKGCEDLIHVKNAVRFLLYRCKEIDDEIRTYGADNEAYQSLIDAISGTKWDTPTPPRESRPAVDEQKLLKWVGIHADTSNPRGFVVSVNDLQGAIRRGEFK